MCHKPRRANWNRAAAGHTLLAAIIGLAASQTLNAQLCTAANLNTPPCVLTAGYAGPASDVNFNKRQNVNPYEVTLSPGTLPSSPAGQLFEVDDLVGQLPTQAASNPIMAQPLYVVGITVANPLQGTCNPCNMVIAVTLNGTVFAWNADAAPGSNLLWSRQGFTGSATNPPGNGGNALWYDDCGTSGLPVNVQGGINLPFLGILSTPVIDASGVAPTPPLMFLTSFCQTGDPQYRWYLHEINLTNGHDVTKTWIGNDVRNTLGKTGFTDAYQWQRPALLEVKNPNNSSTRNLIYVLFGTGAPEMAYNLDYMGWVVAYNAGASGLTPELAYSDEPSGCGTGGGVIYPGNALNGQCTGNAGAPACDCYAGVAPGNAANWGGHGGGCWMSGNGPSATVVGGINNSNGSPDGNVHVFFGCGNGGFQNAGLGGTSSDNFGQTLMDFRLTGAGFDSYPFQTFTPNSPASGVGPPLADSCGCTGSGTTGCGPCSYTFQTMNAQDYDQAVSGVTLYTGVDRAQHLLAIDKAGYGYLLTQGNLCGQQTADQACVGFAQGDPGSWTFGAVNTFCTGLAGNCHRVPGVAVTDNQKNSGPPSWAMYINYWPNQERLTALAVSDNNTLIQGTVQLTTDTQYSKALDIPGGTCNAGLNCLPEQVVPGDAVSLDGCPCTVGTCPVITAVSSTQMFLNVDVLSVFGSCTFPQNFHYAGYLVTPAHDYGVNAPTAGYPGGALTVSEDCVNQYCTNQLIWAIVPDQNSKPDSLQRGLGTLYAYTALPSSDVLAKDWASTDTWCASSAARPTVVDGSAFAPTYAVSTSGHPFQGSPPCPLPTTSGIPYASGILKYH